MRLTNFLSSFNPKLIKKPFIIAEAGVNHEADMNLAKRLINEAKEGGADAIKFQTYKAETIASKNSPYYWDISKEPTSSQFELFKKYDKFWKKEYEELKRYCDEADIEFMSTPFDIDSAIFLNDLMDIYKISSSDLTNLPFIEFQCKFNKPIILSTGASYQWEIQRAVDVIERNKNMYCLMHCVLNYPTENKNAHLGRIWELKEKFPNAIPGYSDHTLPQEMQVILYSTLLGAAVIEKHFTFDKSLPGNDHYHSMDKNDLKLFTSKWMECQELLGNFDINSIEGEEKARSNARRSLVAKKQISKGTIITAEQITWKRPASGICPSEIEKLVGKVALDDIEEDTVLKWNMFD